jgi:histone-arginine methyltransferase CARM1
MLQDTVRTGVYRDAILNNPTSFAGKTVMDVGAGSGILAFFAAKAGAAHVFAVEASDVADRAATLLAANGMADRITVIKSRVEEVALPPVGGGVGGGSAGDLENGGGHGASSSLSAADGKVDVLVSEPMGFMLIHERWAGSGLGARPRHGGASCGRAALSCTNTTHCSGSRRLTRDAIWGR